MEYQKTVSIDRDAKCTANLWISLFKGTNTKLNFSTAYHPQTDGQTKWVNKLLEDMLRMYVMNQAGKWEGYIHLVEFYSLKMSPSEVLYGRRCKVPLSWGNLEDMMVLG